MTRYILFRLLYMVPTLFLISIVAFIVIQLPPGDYLGSVVAGLQRQGQRIDPAYLEALRQQYGLDGSIVTQYTKWITNIVLHQDFGYSFQFGRPVSDVLLDRLPLTVALTSSTLVLSWAIALPVGIYSATHQYSPLDYIASGFSFLGMAIPGFLILLVAMFVQFKFLDWSVGGLFSPEWIDADWNLGKVLDLLKHISVPVIVLALEGTAGTIRVLRANLLDELHQPYVTTARAKGLTERTLILRYPVRVALNPFISTIGWVLPALLGGEVIISTVASLNTTGPVMLQAMKSQDMYLAGGAILIISALTLIGTLLSDIALAAIDPRVRAGYK